MTVLHHRRHLECKISNEVRYLICGHNNCYTKHHRDIVIQLNFWNTNLYIDNFSIWNFQAETKDLAAEEAVLLAARRVQVYLLREPPKDPEAGAPGAQALRGSCPCNPEGPTMDRRCLLLHTTPHLEESRRPFLPVSNFQWIYHTKYIQ